MSSFTIGDVVQSSYGMNFLVVDASDGLCMMELDCTRRGREPVWYVPPEYLELGNGKSGYEKISQVWMGGTLKEILNSARPYYVNPEKNAKQI